MSSDDDDGSDGGLFDFEGPFDKAWDDLEEDARLSAVALGLDAAQWVREGPRNHASGAAFKLRAC